MAVNTINYPLPGDWQMDYMNKEWTVAGVTATNQFGTIGMYGSNGSYYLYISLITNDNFGANYSVATGTFRFAIQVGDASTGWEGLYLTRDLQPAITAGQPLKLQKYSATMAAKSANNWGDANDETDFEGLMYAETASLTRVTMIRPTLDWE